ncbi:hypothetical protein tinsulaeT_00700 [Thalassotalea insulae]|uniref:Lipocalin-like domain-containing protein n=1 Tax=Thalassotalea insulae TaxID=2056778 RepID=A0ABQ6GPU0_9GAMM|nr:hypothetical protein [Thalassotalea insulae]GLX76730.1 hypothetical protein tinsulaeT_00700 [Thalassotalea insulae]
MKSILAFLLIFFPTITQAANEHSVIGTWVYTIKGNDFTDIKTCTFAANSDLKCIVEEVGYSDGFGDAHKYKTKGKWFISNNKLTMSESVLGKSTSINFNIVNIKSDTLVLMSEQNFKQVWQRSLSAN